MKFQNPDDASRLVLRRTYAVRREKVFRAWTDPEQIVKWMSPREGVCAESAEFDLRVGGQYRIHYRTPTGLLVVGGVFSLVAVPEKLVYTWVWEPPNEYAEAETLVTVEFLDRDGATELVLTHERFPNQKMRDNHQHGWTGGMQSLAAFVDRN
jgi:uncharacterized protein YndB with AHSA1/START domain